MKPRLFATAAIFLALAAGAVAHRLDEYLQATIFSVEKDRIQASMRLIPGVAVSSRVIASVDINNDGVFSEAEQQAYAQRVLNDLSITVDGKRATAALVSQHFPSLPELKEGLGEIHIEFTVALPPGGPERKVTIENHHQSAISAYLVNCLVPSDSNIQIRAQNRNETQSFYQLVFSEPATNVLTVAAQPATAASPIFSKPWSDFRAWTNWTYSVGFVSLFRLGMHHIAEGTDHLLFLLTLLLPAPLLVVRSRWIGFAGTRHSLLQILKVVTAFTLGHSLTLALAALGVVHVPSRPIEILIAISILVSAIHALRPLFPGREALIAIFFGLIHGLAFAATLTQLGLGRWQRLAGILSFNLGIEAMQLAVVGVILPSLLLLSRTNCYALLRITGALLAAAAAAAWLAERTLGLHTAVDAAVNAAAHQAPWAAATLFLLSVVAWRNASSQRHAPSPPPEQPQLTLQLNCHSERSEESAVPSA